jgi:outer membrane protein assembly factor BamD (BamD/ComL family)
MRKFAQGATKITLRRFSVFFTAAVLIALAVSCASLPPPIPEGATAAEIIQRAQDRSDLYDWKGAQYYYTAILERFPADKELIVTAKYELAFIEYKQGHDPEAIKGFEEILRMYEAPEGAALQARWKILSEKILEKIRAKGR